MKQFLKTLLFFGIFLAVLYPIFIFFWGTIVPKSLRPNLNYPLGSYGHMYSRISEIKNKDFSNIDVLFLGSSHSYLGFDTRIFEENGIESFNLGSSAQTPIQTRLLLERYLDKIDPEIIVYEVYPLTTFASDGVESSLDIIANDKNDLHSLKMAISVNHIKTYNALTYGYMRELLNLDSSFEEPRVKSGDTYISGGFVEKKLKFNQQEEISSRNLSFRRKQLDAFNDVISMIKKRNIKLILVQVPVTKSQYQNYASNKKFDKMMNKYATYYNFNELLELDDSKDFLDAHHLNQNGVEKFNEAFIKKTDLARKVDSSNYKK